jgi:cbb3-type cytochrome oxidase subunit 3
MIQNVLQHIGGIANYGVISLGLLFAVFVGVLVWTCRLKKADLDSAATLPLKDDPSESASLENPYE